MKKYTWLDGTPQNWDVQRKPHGGSGGGGTSTTTQEIPVELKPLATDYTNRAMNLANTDWQGYEGQRYADMNALQNMGAWMTADRALNGSQIIDTGNAYLQNMLTSAPRTDFGGGGSVSAMANPYGYVSAMANPYGNVTAGSNDMTMTAGVNDSRITPGVNRYAGQNKYLDDSIGYAMDDMSRGYNQSIRPGQLQAQAASGSFGNSGLQEMQLEQERQLAQEMGRMASNMRFNDYTTQQGLAESALARDMAAQQFNSGIIDSNLARDMAAQQTNIGIRDSNINRALQAAMANQASGDAYAGRSLQAGMANQASGDAYAGRSLQAGMANQASGDAAANRAMQAYMGAQSNNLQGLNLAQQYGNQAYQDASQLMNVGQMYQDQAQNNLDFGYQQYLDKQNDPYKKLAAESGVFGSNLGASSTTRQSGGGK